MVSYTNSWLLVVLSLVASGIFTVAINLIRQKKFLWGVVCLTTGASLDVVSLQFGPQSMKAIISPLPILINIVLERYIFKDGNSPGARGARNIILLLLMVVGCVISASGFMISPLIYEYASSPNETYTHVTSVTSLSFIAVLAVAVYTSMLCVDKLPTMSVPIITGLSATLTMVFSKAALHFFGTIYVGEVVGFVYGALCSTLAQLIILKLCMVKFQGVQMYITIFTLVYITLGTLSGFFIYRENALFSDIHWIMFGIGTGMSIIALVTWLGIGIVTYI